MANFKVRCVIANNSWWTKGKIYEIKEGYITDDDGDTKDNRFYCVSDLNKYCCSENGKISAAFELVTEDYVPGTMPTLEQIQEFDLVKLRDGRFCMVIMQRNGLSTVTHNCVADYCDGGISSLRNYGDDVKHLDNTIYDVVAYKHFKSHREALYYFVAGKEPSWDWIRQEPKEMTLKQLEDVLGYPVKIVKED